MATKAVLEEELADANEKIENFKSQVSDLQIKLGSYAEKVSCLKEAVAYLEQSKARLEGYIDRVNQVDRSNEIKPDIDRGFSHHSYEHPKPISDFGQPEQMNGFVAMTGAGRLGFDYERESKTKWFEL